MYIFDLDGTLVDTKVAVKEAYKRVGIEMPDDAWGKPASEWLPVKWLHDQKNRHYPGCLRAFADKLPLYKYAERNKCPVITGASRQAVVHVQEVFGKLTVDLCGATAERKAEYLIEVLESSYGSGTVVTYVDDDEQVRDLVRKKVSACIIISPSEACQQLSQQLALIPD